MKKFAVLFALIVLTASSSFAQIFKPVKWEVASKKTSKNEAVIFIKAVIDNGWHIYSQGVGEGGPIPTSFTFKPAKDFKLVGKTAEPKPLTKYENVFKMNVPYFDKQVVFQQKVKLVNGKAVIKGTVEYMACDKSRCLPPEEYDFAVTIK
ncbi:sugar transporter [Sphingobacteriaceae bacterium WQ 2009]|uniref:Sugar transporter n=1 Tax=Rhinopithecimicrobium faecis TaxID=2820698 RepID=A0A8T4HAG2_9SPHI|nr:sugar transporter [Sphingobacteriaceae bacterium WQ 2009]